MAEKVGTIYYDLDLDDAKYKSKAKSAGTDADNFGSKLQSASLQLAALGAAATLALTQVVNYLDKAVDAAVRQQNALMGLSSVARGTGNSIDAATQAAKDLSADGLMPLGDAAAGLKNLLAAGFSLPEAIKLMNAFKDSAAFGRQGALEFGQSIVGATEGIKNGNSILVDNAGVTKNLSNMLVEAGYSAQDLAKASDDAGVRQAIFNGVLKETKNQMGDAEKLADSFGGAQARMKTQVTNLYVALGTALQPVLTKIMEALAPIIDKVMEFVRNNPQLVAVIAILVTASLALVAVLGLFGALVGAIMSLAPLFSAIGAVIAGITAPALAIIAAVIGAVILVVWTMKQHWETIVSLFNQYLKPALDQIWNSLKTLWSSLMELWKVLEPILIPILKVLGVVLLVILGVAIAAVVASVWVAINVLNILVNVFTWLVTTIKNAVVGAWNALWGFVQNVINAFINVKNAVSDGVSNAVNAVKNFISNMVNAGKDLIDGLIRGIGNAKDAVVNKIKEICGGALDAVKSFFGIKSPSRVMAEMGGFMMQGMENGIVRAGDAVVSATEDISQRITNGMQSSIQTVTDGAKSVVGVYNGMYGQLNAMDMQSTATLNGTVSAINNAAAAAPENGSIAQPPVNVTIEQSGIVARSRSEFRDIIADGIEAVNEDLRARGYDEIGNGKVKGMSTA